MYQTETIILRDPELRKKILKSFEKKVPQGFSENYYDKPIPGWAKLKLCTRK
jgi:hypothetical protein